MADVIKLVDRGIANLERSQVFTQADASAADVILVQESLGRPAPNVQIEAVAAMSVRFNVYRTRFPLRKHADGFSEYGLPNLALGDRRIVESTTPVAIGAGETFELDGDIPVRDIQIVSAAGDFSIFVA